VFNGFALAVPRERGTRAAPSDSNDLLANCGPRNGSLWERFLLLPGQHWIPAELMDFQLPTCLPLLTFEALRFRKRYYKWGQATDQTAIRNTAFTDYNLNKTILIGGYWDTILSFELEIAHLERDCTEAKNRTSKIIRNTGSVNVNGKGNACLRVQHFGLNPALSVDFRSRMAGVCLS
jgi:hypothetical protein